MNLLPLSPIVTRLKTPNLCPSFRLFGTAADLTAAAKARTPAKLAAYVVLLGAEGHDVREGSGPLRQDFDVQVSVLLRQVLSGLDGAAGLKQLETPAGEIRAALFGWQHPDADLRFTIASEGLEDFDPTTGVTLYRIDFQTRVRLMEPLT
ncbi:hypothetical protein [Phenylobacterium sp.]|uniref:phage tail terminator protein n=1 Tax=Phenylobacterium sp. TaxID=1871053 RepID=UPI003918D454